MKNYNKIMFTKKIAFYLFLFAFIFGGISGFVKSAGAAVAGDRCSDGTVYVSSTLRTTPSDAPTDLAWTIDGCAGGDGDPWPIWIGANSTTNGLLNTNKAVTKGGSWYPAAWYCSNLVFGGHSDWFLPARSQFQVLYANKNAIGGFVNPRVKNYHYIYWSSTETAYDLAVLFLDGTPYLYTNKCGAESVRCVRTPGTGEACLSYALTITKAGTGSGIVTSNVGGISCGATCSATYSSGTPVIVTATPNATSTFAGWSGACTGTGTCSVTMTSAKTLTATFNPIPTVTLSSNPSSIIAGASSTLTWNVTNATSCLSTGTQVLWAGSTTLATSTGFWPTGILNTVGTSTYGITCNGAGGTASATTTVTVGAAPIPTVTLSSNPPSILAGASSTLTWNVTNATSCTATGETLYWAGSNLATSTGAHTWDTGILNEVRPYIYGMTCVGLGGSASATTTVTATSGPSVSVTLNASPSIVNIGQASTLTRTITNATSCTAGGGSDSDWDGSSFVNGTVDWTTRELMTTGSHTYQISCTGNNGPAFATTTVTVNIGTINNPSAVSGGANPDKCQAVDVSWSAYSGAHHYEVMCVGGTCTGISTTSLAVTIRNLSTSTPYSFIIQARNSSGDVIASATTSTVMSGDICTGPTGTCSILKSPTSSNVNHTTTWTASSTPSCIGCTYTWSGTDINSSLSTTLNTFPKIYTTVGFKNINVEVKNPNNSPFCSASGTTTVSFSGGTTVER
jgi:hypothetical protein